MRYPLVNVIVIEFKSVCVFIFSYLLFLESGIVGTFFSENIFSSFKSIVS